jgi:hypothetical protein
VHPGEMAARRQAQGPPGKALRMVPTATRVVKATESGTRARGRGGSAEECGGLQLVVVLTPDGGQLINVGIGRGFEFSVVSQMTAARHGVDRSKLEVPLALEAPSGVPMRATQICTIAFPQERAVGGKMVIFAFLVDALEEYYEAADATGCGRRRIPAVVASCAAGRPPVLRADPGQCDAQPRGGEPVHVEVPRVQGRQMTETVWLTAARAWNMPVS